MKIKDIGNYLEEEDILNLIFFMTGGLSSVWFLAVRLFHTIEFFFEIVLFSYSFLSIDKPFLPESSYHYCFYHFIIITIIIIVTTIIITITIIYYHYYHYYCYYYYHYYYHICYYFYNSVSVIF